ncbi:hypothetical protein Q4574_11105 [Aliiglaciecola sp. 3_MG-2023]|uniref:hypothetical protein n=1 Tax=Aliiglaciecola sp. 3_MG-2023 TaxID=3062644 RepID=UPI0026E1BBB6|nr:hypothetical protein [Aliiglaciecola sp. 3_MG-2023]MDO6693837.1 hypothetical protein [Aliiglaciecola sp. 3_MG-2023]
MLGTQHITTFIQSLFTHNRPALNAYSPFLRVTKPLIDLSKRANINQHARYLNNENCSEGTIQRALWQEQSALITAMLAGADFRALILQAIAQIGYKVTSLCERNHLISRSGARAILWIANPTKLTGTNDETWQQHSIVELGETREEQNCDAAIYISLGGVANQHRSLSKSHDIFVLSGWEVLRLLHDTELWRSPTFCLLNSSGGRA